MLQKLLLFAVLAFYAALSIAEQPVNLSFELTEDKDVILQWHAPQGAESELLFHESFEGLTDATFPPEGWMNVDNDGDDIAWILFDVPYDPEINPYPAYDGEYAAASYSWFNGQTLTPDNWLITPSIQVPDNGLLHWAIAAQRPNFSQEHYKVKISTTGTDTEDFTTLLHEETLPEQDITWKTRQYDLTEYAGEQIHVAFVHTQTTDLFAIKLDDIRLYDMPGEDLDGYRIYRNNELVKQTDDLLQLSWTDVNPGPGQYQYHVTAMYGEQESGSSNTIEVTIEADAINFPPQNLTISETQDMWTLSWETPKLDDVYLWEDFSGLNDNTFPPAGWQNIDNDEGEMAWILFDVPYDPELNPYPAYSGDQAIASYSWFNGNTYTPDNWFITPAVELGANATLSWAVAAQRANYSQEHYKVFLSVDGNDVDDFTILLHEETLPEQDITWKPHEIDLSEYQGQTVHVAFVHTETTDLFAIKLDAIKLEGKANLNLTGYQVFKNNEMIAQINDPQTLEHQLPVPAPGEYEFYVKAVYDLGVSIPSNQVSAQSLIHYNVTISSEGPGTTTPQGEQTLAEGDDISIMIQADSDAHISDVLLDGVSVTDQLEINRTGQPSQGTLHVDGVSDNHTVHAVFQTSTNLQKISDNSSFRIFPNPAKDKLWVEFFQNSDKYIHITIYSMQGQLVKEKKINNPEKSRAMLDISDLIPGIYTLNINHTQQVVKVIIR